MRSNARLMIYSFGLAMVLMSGCGPTKEGMQARNDAKQRMDAMTTHLSYQQAKQSFEVGQFDRALKTINKAISRYPDEAKYYVLQGRIHLETHRLEDALKSFENAIQHNPELPEPHYYAGIVYQRWSKDREAYEAYYRAWERDDTKVQYLLAAAESLIALDNLDAAESLVKPKIAYFENNAALHHLLGTIAQMKHEPRRAAELMHKAHLLQPENHGLLEELAWVQYDAEMFNDCYQSVVQLQSIKENENRTDLKHLEARCLALTDRVREARDLFLQLSSEEPTNADIWIELGTVAWELGDYRRVALCGARATALAPGRFEGYMLKAVKEREHGNHEQATELMEQAADRAPDNVTPHLLLSALLEDRGRYDAATQACVRALDIAPNNAKAQAMFSRISSLQSVTAVDDSQ